ncbi:MAG: hypothetical protein IPK22_25420 [Verrucomicrobiaceae bacterium]|nr:hypothetical protein [Verrucomicrobiaceae bacterium]
MKRLLALVLLASPAFAGSKADPADWILWRAAPIAFPDSISPQVPEMMQGEPLIDFTPTGTDLTIVMPDGLGDDYDSKALDWAKRYVIDKVKGARVVESSKVTDEDLKHHLLCLGTLQNNAFAAKIAGSGFLDGITPGGYRIKTADHPLDKTKRVILALGADLKGAYSAGAVLCHAIHPNKPGVNDLQNWPVKVPPGCYWIPFEARAAPPVAGHEKTAFPNPPPPKPRVPFAVRVWGSPMPDLPSYQRMVRALKPTGMNTIVVQSGGLVDLPDAAQRFVSLLDIAWQEGIYTCLYVGNEEEAHKSAPLTDHHKAVILATKDHPGLLAFHLYNQLGTKDSPEQYQDLEQQVRWIDSLGKPTSVEVVIGHNAIDAPPDKVKLMRDLKAWGIDVIGTDYAPIGGWSNKPDLMRWETKMLAWRPHEAKTEVLIQAHVPFVGATVPSKEQVRNQFWWALSGGVHGYFVEVAYNVTHMSMRGLLSWDFKPLPDGRFEAVTEIAADSQKMAELITETEIVKPEDIGLALTAPSKRLHLRARKKLDGTLFALLINEDLQNPASARITLKTGIYQVTDVLTAKDRGKMEPTRTISVQAQPGGAVVLKLHLTP